MIAPEILELKRQMNSLHRNFYSLASRIKIEEPEREPKRSHKDEDDEKRNKEKDKKEDKKRRE
jgi:hypothetical protein